MQAVGMDAAKAAAQNMQMLLPQGAPSTSPANQNDTITSIIAGMSKPGLYAIISQVKLPPFAIALDFSDTS